MTSHLSRLLARGASGTLLAKGATAGLMFATQLLAARVLGSEAFGIYILALGWLSILTLVATMGMDTNTLRYLPAYCSRQDWPHARGLLQWTFRNAFWLGLALTGAGSLAVWALGARIGSEMLHAFWWALAAIPLAASLNVRQATLQALGHVVVGEFYARVLPPLLFATVMAGLYVAHVGTFSAPAATATHLATVGVAAVAVIILLARRLPMEMTTVSPERADGEWLRSTLPLLLLSGMAIVMARIDTLMVGAMIGAEEAGIYAVAARVTELMSFGLISVNAVLAPMISRLYTENRMRELQHLVTTSVRWISAFSVVVGTCIIVAGHVILGWFGDAFVAGTVVLAILVAGQLFNSFCGSVGYLMVMTGGQAAVARVVGVATVLNVAMNLALIPPFGIVGAAVATAAALAGWNVVLAVLVRGRLGINATVATFR
ncbi:MAG: oligosaccharide flippase family protein [Nitrospirota bacterium]|nr:oligosaccharide flippase family protein [Nitrospirota bacterium]